MNNDRSLYNVNSSQTELQIRYEQENQRLEYFIKLDDLARNLEFMSFDEYNLKIKDKIEKERIEKLDRLEKVYQAIEERFYKKQYPFNGG